MFFQKPIEGGELTENEPLRGGKSQNDQLATDEGKGFLDFYVKKEGP